MVDYNKTVVVSFDALNPKPRKEVWLIVDVKEDYVEYVGLEDENGRPLGEGEFDHELWEEYGLPGRYTVNVLDLMENE